MYRLDEQDRLRHDVMEPPRHAAVAVTPAAGLWSTADGYCGSMRIHI